MGKFLKTIWLASVCVFLRAQGRACFSMARRRRLSLSLSHLSHQPSCFLDQNYGLVCVRTKKQERKLDPNFVFFVASFLRRLPDWCFSHKFGPRVTKTHDAGSKSRDTLIKRTERRKQSQLLFKQNRNNSKNASKTNKARKMRQLTFAKEYAQVFCLFFTPFPPKMPAAHS